jgi:hypothetical protein
MKKTLLALFILCTALCTSAAFGQVAASISSQAQPLQMADHIARAEQHDMAQERPLVGGTGGTYTYAQGERPLWEFGPSFPPPTPLGDVARAYRKEKLAAKKAEIVFEKQGS